MTLWINQVIKGEVASIENRIAFVNDRYHAIDQALFQFRFAQTNALTFGVMSASETIRPEFRKSMIDLMFITRKLPGETMLQEINFNNAAAFQAERKAYLDLIEQAQKAESQADWDAVSAFEFAHEEQLFNIQQAMLTQLSSLEAEKRTRSASLETAVFGGFAIQQLGFVLVLLAGLLYQHRQGAALPPVEPKPPVTPATAH